MLPSHKSVLVPGRVTPQHFEVLLSFTGIRGEMLVAALRAYFVDGLYQCEAIEQTGVNQSLLSRKITALQAVSDRLAEASQHYL